MNGASLFKLNLERGGFDNQKELEMFARKCLTMIRQSPEYKNWTEYIKDYLGHRTCIFTDENSSELTIEIHHHPLTLFDIVMIVLSTRMQNSMPFSSLDIARDVLLLHYNNNIGYLPMVTSLHEKFHNGFLTIPPKYVLGNWKYLLVTDGYVLDNYLYLKVSKYMNEKNNQQQNYIWIKEK